jgi:hypothetical protein
MAWERVWIAAAAAAGCVLAGGCDGQQLAQPARDHRAIDEAAVPAAERAPGRRPTPAGVASAPTTRLISGRPMWADSRRYTAEENAAYQFAQHGEELGAKDLDDFLAKAHRFVNDPPKGARSLVRANGDHLYYDAGTGLFGVAREDGAPRTVFKPSDGESYWAQQVRENGAGA